MPNAYNAQRNHRVINLIGSEKQILVVLTGDIKFYHPLSRACSIKEPLLSAVAISMTLVFELARGGTLLPEVWMRLCAFMAVISAA